MSDPHNATAPQDVLSAEVTSALFAQLIMQQANMAMMLLGQVPHPESGQIVKDLEAARFFIDQLEMLEVKTKGNLTQEESRLLKQSLMRLRLAFVEAVEPPQGNPPASAEAATAGESAQPSPAPSETPAEDDEHRKKFSKKY